MYLTYLDLVTPLNEQASGIATADADEGEDEESETKADGPLDDEVHQEVGVPQQVRPLLLIICDGVKYWWPTDLCYYITG